MAGLKFGATELQVQRSNRSATLPLSTKTFPLNTIDGALTLFPDYFHLC